MTSTTRAGRVPQADMLKRLSSLAFYRSKDRWLLASSKHVKSRNKETAPENTDLDSSLGAQAAAQNPNAQAESENSNAQAKALNPNSEDEVQNPNAQAESQNANVLKVLNPNSQAEGQNSNAQADFQTVANKFSVTERLKMLLKYSQTLDVNNNSNQTFGLNNNNSELNDSLHSQEDVNLETSQGDSMVREDQMFSVAHSESVEAFNKAFYYPNDYKDSLEEVEKVVLELWANFNLENMQRSLDTSYEMFIREAHDVPHSSVIEETETESCVFEMSGHELTELSTVQLIKAIENQVRALTMLIHEATLRKMAEVERSSHQSSCSV